LSDQIELVFAQTLLAEALRQNGQTGEAASEIGAAFDRIDSVAQEFKDQRIDDIAYFHAYVSLQSVVHGMDGNKPPEETLRARLNDAITRLTDLVKRTPSIRHFRSTLGQAHAARAHNEIISGRLEQASADANSAREILEALAAQYPAVADHHSDVAWVHDTLGRIALARGEQKIARRHFEEATKLQRRALEPAPKNRRFLERLARHQEGIALCDAGVP
jgi:hypothetical protein